MHDSSLWKYDWELILLQYWFCVYNLRNFTQKPGPSLSRIPPHLLRHSSNSINSGRSREVVSTNFQPQSEGSAIQWRTLYRQQGNEPATEEHRQLSSSIHLLNSPSTVQYFPRIIMMFTTFNTDCDSSSRCSTASPSNADNIGYYPSPGSQSSIGSPQSQVRFHSFIQRCIYSSNGS